MADAYKCKREYGCGVCKTLYADLVDAEDCCSSDEPSNFVDLYPESDDDD